MWLCIHLCVWAMCVFVFFVEGLCVFGFMQTICEFVCLRCLCFGYVYVGGVIGLCVCFLCLGGCLEMNV